jgi:hypothetical protein
MRILKNYPMISPIKYDGKLKPLLLLKFENISITIAKILIKMRRLKGWMLIFSICM